MSTKPIEKTAPNKESDNYKLQTYFQDLEKQANKVLTEKYGHLVPPERLQSMANQPTSFERQREFVKTFKAETGVPPEPGLVGYTERNHPAHVNIEDAAGVAGTEIHEKLHKLADEQAPRIFGEKLYEGVTEDLAIKTAGREPGPEDIAYPEARASAHLLREKVGDNAVEEAYFKGDTTKLKERLDSPTEKAKAE